MQKPRRQDTVTRHEEVATSIGHSHDTFSLVIGEQRIHIRSLATARTRTLYGLQSTSSAT
jgi:hypothetical protein